MVPSFVFAGDDSDDVRTKQFRQDSQIQLDELTSQLKALRESQKELLESQKPCRRSNPFENALRYYKP
jgi:hypothetical protein